MASILMIGNTILKCKLTLRFTPPPPLPRPRPNPIPKSHFPSKTHTHSVLSPYLNISLIFYPLNLLIFYPYLDYINPLVLICRQFQLILSLDIFIFYPYLAYMIYLVQVFRHIHLILSFIFIFYPYFYYMVHLAITFRLMNPVLTFRYVVVNGSRLESLYLLFKKRLATMVFYSFSSLVDFV